MDKGVARMWPFKKPHPPPPSPGKHRFYETALK